MLIRNFSDFKFELVELLIGKQLDKAYKQGITIGAEYAARKMSFEVSPTAPLEADQDRATRLRPRNRSG
jgi:hypothetical protein